MIAHLSGKLLDKQPNQVTIDVQGVGYEVHIPLSTFYEVGEIGSLVQLRIYTHVREDTIALFGFKSSKEKLMFEQVTSISGIGPKLGITILSGMPVDELVAAIRQSNLARLTSIPGIGKKTAERLVVELRDKLSKLEPIPAGEQGAALTVSQQQEDVISALVNLGYGKPSAEKAVQRVVSASGSEPAFEELLRSALQQLSR
ncbi:MAG: Holliday junction branch migration protein RuvA [Acidobacteria bacterium]|nr:Holliday junction branch migration protein RuvA [Acidobacteriota bacterium]MCI0621033.1 Holliday junction branch migration protein RuvA [Acidobacteriota bacterium]MCI0721793.1 Holliday junction branch migration protein RuvA [Acidobacteriota bacterium]